MRVFFYTVASLSVLFITLYIYYMADSATALLQRISNLAPQWTQVALQPFRPSQPGVPGQDPEILTLPRSTPTPASPPVTRLPAPPPPPPLLVRTWTSTADQSFNGLLVTKLPDAVLIRRASDSQLFRVPLAKLSPSDHAYLASSAAAAAPQGDVPGIYHLPRKLYLPGFIVDMTADPKSPQTTIKQQSDPMYFALLTTLSGAQPRWLRIDAKSHARLSEDSLVDRETLAAFLNLNNEFTETLAWPRPELTLLEAYYSRRLGPRFPVTHRLMKLVDQGRFPATLTPELFSLSPHEPDIWELTLTWSTPSGKVTSTIRDGGLIAWP